MFYFVFNSLLFEYKCKLWQIICLGWGRKRAFFLQSITLIFVVSARMSCSFSGCMNRQYYF